MDRFEDAKVTTNRFKDAPAEPLENGDTPLSQDASDYFTGLEKEAFEITPESPVQTVEDLRGSYEYAQSVANEREAGIRQDIVEDLAAQRLINPAQAIDFYNAPDREQPLPASLESLAGENVMIKAGVEDNDARNYILEDIAGSNKLKNLNTNMRVLQSHVTRRKDDTSFIGGVWDLWSAMLPFKEIYKGSKTSLDPDESYFWNPQKAEDIKYRNMLKNSDAMRTMLGAEYDTFLSKYEKVLEDRGLTNSEIARALTELVEPDVDAPALSLGMDVMDTVSVAGAAVNTLVRDVKAARVIKATGKGAELTVKEIAKDIAKETGKALIETTPGLTTTGKLVKKGVSKGKRFALNSIDAKKFAGNLDGAAKSLAEDLKSGKAVVEDALEAREKVNTIYHQKLEPSFKPTYTQEPQVGRSEEVEKSLLTVEGTYNIEEQVAEQLADLTVPQLRKEAIEKAFKNAWEEPIESSSNIAQISDMQPIFTGSGKVQGQVIIGNNLLKNPAKGFASKEQAGRAIERWIKDGDWSAVNKKNMDIRIYQADNGRYYIQFTGDLAPNIGKLFADYTEPALKGVKNVKTKVRGTLLDKLLGARGSLPTTWEWLTVLSNRDARVIQNALEPFQKNLDNLSKTKMRWVKDLKEIFEGYWPDPKYLLNAGVPEDVVVGLQSLRVIEDVQYMFRTQDILRGLAENNFKRIILGKDPEAPVVTGKIVDPDDANFERWFTTGKDEKGFVATKEDFKGGKFKDFNIIEQVEDLNPDRPAGSYYRIFPKNETRVGPLEAGNFGYIPGGRIYYDPKASFIKQPVFATMPSGRKKVVDVRTIRGASIAADANDYVRELESIREQVIEYLQASPKAQAKTKAGVDAAIREASGKYFSFNSTDDAMDFFKENHISLDPDAKLGVVKEGDDSLMQADDLASLLGEKEAEEFKKYMKRSSYTSSSAIDRLQRGEGVLDISTDSHLPWIDAAAETKRVIRDTERYGSMNMYTELFANEWYNYFKKILPDNVDPVKALRDGKYLAKAPKNLVDKANYARDIHNYIRGIPNRLDAAIERALVNTFNSIGEDMPWLKKIPFLGNAFEEGTKTFEAVTKLTPLNWLRTWTAHWYLGFFNPRQFFSQSAAIWNTIAISPVHGVQAIPYSLVIPGLVTKYDDATLEAAVAQLKMYGVNTTAKDLKVTVDNVREMGVFGPTVKGGALEGVDTTASKLERLSLVPFTAGENINRAHSAIVALMDKKMLTTPIKGINPTDFAQLLVRQGDLYMNMGKTGIATAQMSGFGKTVLQMKGFQLRALETVLKRNLTAAERRRLLFFNLVMTGVNGTLGSPRIAYNVYDWMTDNGISHETALALQEGLLNTLSRQYGLNIDFASFLAPEYLGLADDIMDMAMSSPLKFVAGSTAAGKTWNTIGTTLNFLVGKFYKQDDAYNASNLLSILAAQKALPSSANRLNTGLHMMFEGRKLSTSGKMVAKDVTNTQAIMTLVGFDTISEKDVYEYSERLANYNKRIDNTYEDVLPYFKNWMENEGDATASELFFNYFAAVCDNYKLSDLDRSEVWQKLKKVGKDYGSDAFGRSLRGLYRIYGGFEQGEEYYRARRREEE